MRINAYILAADPSWIESSVLSYYDLVDRIVVSFDANGLGYTGVSVDIEQCLSRLKAIDSAEKLDLHPGHFARREFFSRPMENETHQRRAALAAASEDAEWVLQLDTDEVLADNECFRAALAKADRLNRNALNYPAINIWSVSHNGRFLEQTDRGWRRMGGYPGPMAVRAGSHLTLARRVGSGHFHVDLHQSASKWAVPNDVEVDLVIPAEKAIFHFSWVRSEDWLKRKIATWSHSCDRDWTDEIERWRRARKHPIFASLMSQFERGPRKRHLKLTLPPPPVLDLLERSEEDTRRLNIPVG